MALLRSETFPNPYICTVILQKSARCCLFRLLSQRTRQCWGKGVPGHVTSLRVASLVSVRVLRRPVIRPDVQLLRLAIVAEGGD